MRRSTKERKVTKAVEYHGFGFPVILLDVPMVQLRGVWTPDVDYNQIGADLLVILARSQQRLTGNQVRFIRHSWKMTQTAFGRLCGVSHPAVNKWEKVGNRTAPMVWACEKLIRLEILDRSGVEASVFAKAFHDLDRTPVRAQTPLEVGAMLTAAKRRAFEAGVIR